MTGGGTTTPSIRHGQQSQPMQVLVSSNRTLRPLHECCGLLPPLQLPMNPLSSLGEAPTHPPNIMSSFTIMSSRKHRRLVQGIFTYMKTMAVPVK